MPPEALERKLVAILSADVAGYSRLMGDDEEATIRTLTDYRRAIADFTQQYRGRVVDSPGDNLLAEFASVVDAVNCAVEIQRELAKRNAELHEARRMQFRIGVNLGDVVTEGERIYGDGVNIAARIEGLAEAGGICLSGAAHDEIENKIALQFEYLGEQEVKNISKPVRAYRVLMGTEAAAKATGKKTRPKVWRKVAVALGVIVILLAGAASVVWNVYFRLPDVKGVPDGMKDFALPDGPSIAVLPFDNMSGDPDREYFSDGLTENIIAGLSSDGRLLVIARNSTFSYKGKSVRVQEVARELGVEYVVEGSVQKTEDRVRITAQLIDGNTGHHVWSNTYDRELKDIFALQDEITMKIMIGVGMTLLHGEGVGSKLIPPSGSLQVFKKFLKAREYFYRSNREGNILARQELEQAFVLDPEYPVLYSLLGLTHLFDLFYQSSESPLVSFAQASKNVKKAVALDDENWMAYLVLSWLYLLEKEHDKAIAAGERTIALNPNAADAYGYLGWVLTLSGRAEEGIKLIEKGMRLNPIPPSGYLLWLGHAYRFLGQDEDAIEVYEDLIKRYPNNLFGRIWLAATYSSLGREEEAGHQAEELLRIDPKFSVEQFAEFVPIKDEAELERLVADLRKAGLK